MVGTGAVKDVLDLVVLRLSPLLVGRATVLDQSTPDGKKGDGDDGLLVHDVVLAGDGVDGETGGGAEDGALAEEAVTGKRVDDALSLLLGVLGGNIAVVSRGGNGDGRGSSAGEDGSEEGSAYVSRVSRGQRCANWGRIGFESRNSRFLDVPTALRAKRDAIVRWFVMGVSGLVVDRRAGSEVEVLSR